MDLSTHERLWQAVNTMVGPSTIQKRLASAAISLVPLMGQAVFAGHPKQQATLDLVLDLLLGKGEAGGIEAATGAMSDDSARQIASDIVMLFCATSDLTSATS
jgi:hypothetical protein